MDALMFGAGDDVGFIRAKNAGIAFVLGRHTRDYVTSLNNDTQVIYSDWLARLVGKEEAWQIPVI
jgi:hypothetical protein